MSSKYILVSQIEVLPEKLNEAIAKCHSHLGGAKESYRIYISYEDNRKSLLVLTALDESLNYLKEMDLKKNAPNYIDCTNYLISDWRMQVLKLEESVVDLENDLPLSKFLQLRHIEVPLRKYSNYLTWRKNTIFEHVLQQTEIDFFLSYHSLISTEPGVMFLSGFSCTPKEYLKKFNNPKYANIITEAGDQFITGGERGLYTTIYERSYS